MNSSIQFERVFIFLKNYGFQRFLLKVKKNLERQFFFFPLLST